MKTTLIKYNTLTEALAAHTASRSLTSSERIS